MENSVFDVLASENMSDTSKSSAGGGSWSTLFIFATVLILFLIIFAFFVRDGGQGRIEEAREDVNQMHEMIRGISTRQGKLASALGAVHGEVMKMKVEQSGTTKKGVAPGPRVTFAPPQPESGFVTVAAPKSTVSVPEVCVDDVVINSGKQSSEDSSADTGSLPGVDQDASGDVAPQTSSVTHREDADVSQQLLQIVESV